MDSIYFISFVAMLFVTNGFGCILFDFVLFFAILFVTCASDIVAFPFCDACSALWIYLFIL
jgi:hypothetical protein